MNSEENKGPFMKIIMKLMTSATFLCGLSLVTLPAQAGTSCPAQYLNGTPPAVVSPLQDAGAVEVCYPEFADYVAARTRTPLYAAEHLTEEQVEAARGVSRKGIQFHSDTHLPYSMQAQLSDYSRSGYDRGHLANWADSADPDSFTLANIVPQDPNDNRQLWEGIEETTRAIAENEGEVYVVSGPIYRTTPLTSLKNGGRVAVPDYLYKAIYVPATGQAGVYIVRNAAGFIWRGFSLEDLRRFSGVNAFPALPMSVRTSTPHLPMPNMRGQVVPESADLPAYTATPFAGSDSKDDPAFKISPAVKGEHVAATLRHIFRHF